MPSCSALEDIRRCIDPKPGHRVMGVSLVLARGRTVLVADTAVTEMPNAEILADIAVEAAGVARRFGYEPRIALLAFSTASNCWTISLASKLRENPSSPLAQNLQP